MARLGTQARPAVIRAQTEERARELLDYCIKRGWEVIVGVEPDMPEDIADILKLRSQTMHEPLAARREPLPGRNDLCLCGSGAKFKKCCLSVRAGTAS